MFLVTHSKWMEVHITNGCTMIDKLQLSFTTLGLAQVLVSDNDPVFSSSEFKDFMKANGIKHVKSVPYHPASNGLTQRAVQTFKSTLKKTDWWLITALSEQFFV